MCRCAASGSGTTKRDGARGHFYIYPAVFVSLNLHGNCTKTESPPKAHVDVCSSEAQYFPRPSPPGTFPRPSRTQGNLGCQGSVAGSGSSRAARLSHRNLHKNLHQAEPAKIRTATQAIPPHSFITIRHRPRPV
jgi:hypothetical protein